ncbi:hypothetical protein GVN20_24785 [Runella sp. CRIBMP]|uniref:hypothetical protein n=1 Tax=Runella sp. CRIBMP TaxID=2683261 RepID=UPI0014124422|nr:hypothetical protein [Runella sp. CRIBMP]NBB22594.1 hypothetical protein [Runella sp. CRIBMP]
MPQLPRIDSTEAYVRFLTLYRKHNDSCPAPSHTRKKKCLDGTVVEVTIHRRTGLIPEQVKTTFHMMLKKYVDNYNYVREKLPDFVYDESDRYPSLLMNNARMGEWCDCSDRTIYNHRKQLETLGVIKTKFRGRRNDYELWITPEILFGNGEEAKTENPSKTPKIDFLATHGKTFPHSNTNGVIIEKENDNAETLKSGYRENSYGERGGTETPKSPKEGLSEPIAQSEGLGAARRSKQEIMAQAQQERDLRADTLKSKMTPALPVGLEKHFGELLVKFWMYAWKVLYPDREFSKEQQEAAYVAIYHGVYNRFDDARDGKGWADFQARQLEKLDKAAKYYDHHPDAYLPDPYAVQIRGKGYFDQENERGFAGLEAWMKRDEVRKASRKYIYEQEKSRREAKAEKLLKEARRDFERLALGAAQRQEVRGKTQLQLWNYYRLIFAGLGKQYERKFAQQYLDQQASGFTPPKYYQTKRQRKMYAADTIVVEVDEWMTEGDWYYSEL